MSSHANPQASNKMNFFRNQHTEKKKIRGERPKNTFIPFSQRKVHFRSNFIYRGAIQNVHIQRKWWRKITQVFHLRDKHADLTDSEFQTDLKSKAQSMLCKLLSDHENTETAHSTVQRQVFLAVKTSPDAADYCKCNF